MPERAITFDPSGELLALLKTLGAHKVKHSQSTFLEHLVETAHILERWGASEDVCRAGLFHSIYGTEYFKDAIISFDDRPRIQKLLGEHAERLAYIFCAFERASIFRAIEESDARPTSDYAVRPLVGGADILVSRQEVSELLLILWANALEQAPRTPSTADVKSRSQSGITKSKTFLPALAFAELSRAYGLTVASTREASNGEPIMTQPGLRALFNTEDPDTLLGPSWPEKMIVSEGPVERLAGLVDHDLDALIKMKKHHTKAFFRTLDDESTSIFVEPGQERALYEAGFTLYFHNLSASPIDAWLDALDEELGLVHGVTRVSAFASRRGRGLKAHFDQNDNFVCQAQGVKRWRIADNTSVKNPTAGFTVGAKMMPVHQVEAPNGFPAELPKPFKIVEMSPGTVMFMPRGMWHDTETLDTASLHFNIQSGLAMWKDAIEFVLTKTSALHGDDLREPIIRLFENGRQRPGFADELKQKLRALVEEVLDSDIEIDRRAFHRFIMSRRPKNN